MSSGFDEILLGPVAPRDRFAVGDAVRETAVEDADEAVAERPEGGMMGVAGSPSGVVVEASSRRGVERGEGLEVNGIGEAPVAERPKDTAGPPRPRSASWPARPTPSASSTPCTNTHRQPSASTTEPSASNRHPSSALPN